MRYLFFLLLSLVLILPCGTVLADSGYRISADSILKHISVLASDSLEGRKVGEPGEWKAAQYIISVFETAGLQPRGDSGSFLQHFEFTKKIEFGYANRLTINGQDLDIAKDFQPLQQSGSMVFEFDTVIDVGYGIITRDSSYNDYAGLNVNGRAVLIRRDAPPVETDSTNPGASDTTFDRYSSLTSKIVTALDHGVTGILFYSPEPHDGTLVSMGSVYLASKNIPILLLRRAAIEKLGQPLDNPVLHRVTGQTDLVRVQDTGFNVIGFLPGRTDTVSIIGAHYDHLGWGGPTSRYHGKDKKIHYGADDNGSGSAALLELARYFADPQNSPEHSLLFIAFSGEESGTLGSDYYVRNWTVDHDKTRLMVNMDMIGRLAEQENGLAIMGTGTCQEFKDYFEGKEITDLKVVFKESGAGPSDHAAFYHDSIPSLHFFTGAHDDYHTPDDVVDKIDPDGIVTVANLVADIVRHFDAHDGPLTFLRTKDEGAGRRPSNLSVKLGVRPDFISEAAGLGVNGVSPDQPADRAGILKGDLIIGLGQRTIADIYDYMEALEKYRQGDSCSVTLIRGTDTLSVLVHFE